MKRNVPSQINLKQWILLASLYIGYASFLLMKTSIVMSAPAILADPVNHLSTADWGMILSAGTFGGIFGKFLSGWLADRIGGRLVFVLGLLTTSTGLLLFSLNSNLVAFSLVFFLVLMANASGWPSMTKLIGNWFNSRQLGRVWGVISTSSRTGTILATFSIGTLLRWMDWRKALSLTSILGFAVAVLVFLMIREKPSKLLRESRSAKPTEVHPFAGMSLKKAFREFLRSKQFLLMCGMMMGLTILWDFLNFVPLYLHDRLQMTSANSAIASSAFPIGSLISVLLGGYLFDQLSQQLLARLMGAYLFITILSLSFLLILPDLPFDPTQQTLGTLVALFIFGFTVSPAYYLPMSIFSIRFGGPHSGFLSAFLDAIGFFASVIFSLFGGSIAQNPQMGWSVFLILLISITMLSGLLTVIFLLGERSQKARSNV